MALGMEVGLGPGCIVLDGDPAPLPKKEGEPRIFGPFLLRPKGWMHQDATWYGGRPSVKSSMVKYVLSFSVPVKMLRYAGWGRWADEMQPL